jgi:hypothetical protein
MFLRDFDASKDTPILRLSPKSIDEIDKCMGHVVFGKLVYVGPLVDCRVHIVICPWILTHPSADTHESKY